MGDVFIIFWVMELLKWNYNFFFYKIESFKSKGFILGYKEWFDWEEIFVGDIFWYEYKCFLCIISGGNDEELVNWKVFDFSVY